MSDDGEAELTQDDKRILKYVADAAREEMPSRRGFIQGGTAAAALGVLGFGAGSATAQTQPAAGQVGTESNPVDVEAATVNAGDLTIRYDPSTGNLQNVIDNAPTGATIRGDGQTVEQTDGVNVTTNQLTIEQLRLKATTDINRSTIRVEADGVTIQNCHFDGNGANQSNKAEVVLVTDCEGARIDSNTIADSSRHGVLFADSSGTGSGAVSGCSATRNTIKQPRNDGISIEGANVSGISVAHNDIYGSDMRGGIEITDGAHGCLAIGNYVENSEYVISVQDHGGDAPSDLAVVGNSGVNCTYLYEENGGNTNEGVAIVGNAIDGCTTGISLGYAYQTTVIANSVRNASDRGVEVTENTARDYTIVGNIVRGSGNEGIYISGSGRARVDANSVNNSGAEAIRIVGMDSVGVTNNLLSFCSDGVIADDDGGSPVRLVVTGNSVRTGGDMVVIQSGWDAYIVKNNVGDGSVTDNANASNSAISDNITG